MDVRLSAGSREDPDVKVAERTISHRSDIDGLRGLAIAGVLIFHLAPTALPGGFFGVDVFFVISGYLITGIVLRGLAHNSFRLTDFYARRARRLVPALFIVMAVTLILGWMFFLTDEFQHLGEDVIAGTAFSSNVALWMNNVWYFAEETPLMHLWSLGVEEQFYLIWPLFLWAARKTKAPLQLAITAVIASSFTLMILSGRTDISAAFYLPWNRLWELSLGATFAAAQVNPRSAQTRWRIPQRLFPPAQARAVLGITMIIATYIAFNDALTFPGWSAVIPTLGSLLVISSGAHQSLCSRLLSARPIVSLGLISYPLYLWHWPLASVARTMFGPELDATLSVCVASASIVLAALTYKYVELPIRTGRAGALSVSTIGTNVSAAGVLISCGLIGAAASMKVIPARSASYVDVDRIVRATQEDWANFGRPLTGANYYQKAHWTISVSGLTQIGRGPASILFVGDSNMQQYYPRISRIITERPKDSRSAAIAAASGCGPIVVEMLGASPGEDAIVRYCTELLRSAIEYARNPSVDTVVLGAHWYFYLVKNGLDKSRSIDAVLMELQNLIVRLREDGKKVFVILNIPRGVGFDPRHRIHRSLFSPAFTVNSSPVPKGEVVELLHLTHTKIRQISVAGGATVIDPVEFLCGVSSCPALTAAGEPMYKDSAHLRPSFVRDNVEFLDRILLAPRADGSRNH